MSHPTPEEERPFLYAQNAPWMPLDELHERWAAFGRQASTPAAARATSEAFAALAEEREALHTYTLTVQWSQPIKHMTQPLGLHQDSIEGLHRAATHWFGAACALEEHAEQCAQDDEVTHEEDLHMPVGHPLAQRLRVWTIAHHLLTEEMASYPPAQHLVGASLITDCHGEQEEVAQ